MFTSLAATATSVLAPEIGRDLGIAPKLVGVFVGLIYAGAMSASLASGGFVERYGAIRVSQVAVLLCAAGLTMVVGYAARPDALLPLLFVAPVVMGLGYGPITPASSHILARTAPPSRMALTFSIKQTGVPVGAALAGALLPALAVSLGWHTAFLSVAAAGVAIAIVAQLARESLDAHRVPERALSIAGVIAPLNQVLHTPALRELAVCGLRLCGAAGLPDELSRHLPDRVAPLFAGRGGIRAHRGESRRDRRPDRVGRRRGPLRFAAHAARIDRRGRRALRRARRRSSASIGRPSAVIAVSVLFGMTAIGWNGVQLAEVARAAPPGQAGTVTGAAGFITFGGVLVGPPTFALVSALTSGYRTAFALFGALVLASGARLIVRHRK